jgi:hypothetical protein
MAQTYNIRSRLCSCVFVTKMVRRGGGTYALRTAMHPELDTWSGTRNVDFDLMPDLLIESFSVSSKCELD